MTREQMAERLEERARAEWAAEQTDNYPARDLDEIAAELRKMDWQPIATAPKDDAPVVLYMGDWLTPSFITARWDGKDWLVGQHSTVSNPTHWMPLPVPPANTEAVKHG